MAEKRRPGHGGRLLARWEGYVTDVGGLHFWMSARRRRAAPHEVDSLKVPFSALASRQRRSVREGARVVLRVYKESVVFDFEAPERWTKAELERARRRAEVICERLQSC